jgi:transposase
MIQIGPEQRVLLAVEPVDFRKGIDGLAAICRQRLGAEPMSGVVFVFTNRRRTSLKLLRYDGQGTWLCQKRLSKGRFGWWPAAADQAAYALAARRLPVLLWNGDPLQTTLGDLWRPLPGEPGSSSPVAAGGPSREESPPASRRRRGRFPGAR